MLCQICSRYHSRSNKRFGVLCCNACASFFRLNIYNYRTFICTGENEDNKCLKKPSTKAARDCPKCRLRKCLKLGMRLTPVEQISTENFIISSSPLPSMKQTPAAPKLVSEHKDASTTKEKVRVPSSKPEPTLTLKDSLSFARTLDTLLDTAVNYPKLLELYLNYEIRTLLNISLEILHHITVSDRINLISDIFQKHRIIFEELHIVCMICICKLEFYWLPESQQYKIKEAQKIGYKKVEAENIERNRLSELIELSESCLNTFNSLITIK